MKREEDFLKLRNAFPPENPVCHAALMDAVRSVKEENQVKRAPLRIALITAIIIVAMTAVAVAASSIMGWADFYGDDSRIGVPQSAIDQMQVQDRPSWSVGPMTFTATELLTDGHIAMSSIVIRTSDGSPALLTSEPWDHVGAVGENGEKLAQRLGISPDITWIEAARALNLPLYSVRGIQDVASVPDEGGMEDPLWNEDGSMTYFCMLFLEPDAVQSDVTSTLFLRVARIDPETGEESEMWVDRAQTVTLPLCPLLEEKTYLPEKETVVAGCTLQSVHARRYVTGAYVTLTWSLPAALAEDAVYELHDVTLHNAQGDLLPGGMNLSASITTTADTAVIEEMIGVEALPDCIALSDGTLLIAR